ncbi:hypothetical protein [Novosphingobium naphthalenivorans]|uniref:hypothetical protein n=1 Tax=Novosphingobium naphthalenivorans TaxID=273168 RepID=UPI000A3F6DB8|nr:hypothetical protein [Novosphingobium naphthalenivorans]
MGPTDKPVDLDYYANAGSGEPVFVLHGRDRYASGLVRLWALLRHADGDDTASVAEALLCADTMDNWACRLGRKAGESDERFEAFYVVATDGLNEHPVGFQSPCYCGKCRPWKLSAATGQ